MSWLKRLALDRPELRAWALYDWANSAFVTVVITAVFPPFFRSVAAHGINPQDAISRFAFATTIALVIVAVLAPILGTLADYAPVKKKLLAGFLLLGTGSTAAMAFIGSGDWVLAAGLFMLANIGASGSFVFYDALLPHIASREEVDRVSTAGYALGYLGGGLVLAACLVIIQRPDLLGLPDKLTAIRLGFVTVAAWWLLFSVPLFRRVPEPPVRLAARQPGASLLKITFHGVRETFRELLVFRQASLLLLAFLIYNDGIQTIIRMAAIYGEERGIDEQTLISAIVVVQFVGIPFAFAFGQLAGYIGARGAILMGLAVYVVISIQGYYLDGATDFWILALLVAMVQGGCQALSRSLFASMIPRARSSEFFGLFAIFEKFAGIFGPLLFGLAITLTGSSRAAILSVILFFVVGGGLLLLVKVEKGRQMAREEDARLEAATR